MRHAALIVNLAVSSLLLIGTAIPVLAQPFPGRDFPDKGRPAAPAKQDERERVRGEQVPTRPAHDRLSPEDRRQLRRDIDQHGRELYRGKTR